MGLLTVGTPLEWSETKPYADLIRQKGIKQFINIYEKLKDRQNDCLKWGDEVEFTIIRFDHTKKRAYVLLKSAELLPLLQKPEDRGDKPLKTLWHPEYANYMLEGFY
jgi:glutamate--cysteine ligase catalytic subunit